MPSRIGNRFFFYSAKLRRIVACSSKLEKEYALLLEFDPNVTDYCEQPYTVRLFYEGKWRKSRFDFWVKFASGKTQFVEVKYQSELLDLNSSAHQQIAIQRLWCRLHEVDHVVVTDREIWKNPVLNISLRLLFAEYDVHFLKRWRCSELFSAKAMLLVADQPGVTLGDLLRETSHLAPIEYFRLAVIDLIRTHRIDAGIALDVFGPRSRLYIKREGEL